MSLATLLDIGEAIRLSGADDPANAVGFSFSLAPKDATNPDGEWSGSVSILVQNAHNPKEVGAGFREDVIGTDRADVEQKLAAILRPFRSKAP
jgi:hypothetical protein